MLSPNNSQTELDGCRHLNRIDIHGLMSVLSVDEILAISLSVKFHFM